MRRVICGFLSMLLILVLFPVSIKGEEGGDYQVKYVEDDGSFSFVTSYDNFAEAYEKMKENIDYVVINEGISYSPTGIIAMNRGLVYSYPGRSGSNTVNLYEKEDGSGKSTYVERHYQMTYLNSTGRKAQVILNGFVGWIDLKNCDLVPQKIANKGKAIEIGSYSL